MKVDDLPPELRGWVPWVLHGEGESACPLIGDAAVCLWPGALELDLDEKGGRFRQRVFADREVLVPLPGSLERWPQEVELGGKPAVVLQVEERPVVRIPAGEHELTGKFSWPRLPERLAVHPHLARVELSLSGKAVSAAHRGDDGSVWLAAHDAAGSVEPERLEVEVFRRLADGVPMRLTTRLALRVGGRAREVRLSNVLPAGARPLGVRGELPVRLDAQGVLTVQLRPGQFTVEVDAVVPAELGELTAPAPQGPWPEHEVWVFAPDNRVRQLDLSGAPGVDPQRTNLPAEWKSLQALLLGPGTRLTLTTLRRGELEAPPNRLSLRRELWLDLDGEGFTVRDSFSGALHRDHALALEVGDLGHAVADGEDQLIVRTPEGHTGVELRRTQTELLAEWRLDSASRSVPAVGWSADVESLSTVLHLPPGWDLLGASGVDELRSSWISAWNLFDVFFVLVIGLGTARLFGARWGVVALFALVISHGQEGAPYLLWALLLASIALLWVVPAGKLRWLLRGLWWVTAVVLVVRFVSFAVDQAQAAIYPATAERSLSWYDVAAEMTREAPAPSAAPYQDEEGSLGRKSKVRKAELALQQDPAAVVQTGPGVPTWEWRSWNLEWSGPVERTHTIHLWLLSPWQSAVLGFLRIALLGGLLFALLRRPPGATPPARQGTSFRFPWRSPKAQAAAAALLVVSLGPSVAKAQPEEPATGTASLPTADLLEELRRRVTPRRACEGSCVSVSLLQVDVRERVLRVTADVHVDVPGTYQLPGPAQTLAYREITVDGRPSQSLVRWSDGFLHLRLAPGRHKVVLTAPLLRDELVLSLGTPPKRVEVTASGWQVDGVQEDGRVEGSLALTRLAAAEPGADEAGLAPSDLPPWFEVHRRLLLGVTWSVTTTVRRVSPPGQPLVVRLPLLAGEQVTEAGLTVEKGEAVLSFDRDAESVAFESSLAVAPSVELLAPANKPWSEHWTIDCGVLWHCTLDGVAPYEHEGQGAAAGRWVPSFRPWPGEKLTLTVARPEPAAGPSVTIDSARLALSPGTRLTRAELTLRVRNSAGGSQLVELPAEARDVELAVDGMSQPLQRQGSQLVVPLTPGVNEVRMTWQEPTGLSALWRGSEVRVAGGAVNAQVDVRLPRDRWLLHVAALGSNWGPAVLFWPYLLLVLASGFVLSRLPRSPLRAWEWMLLGLGLAVVPAPVAVIVASWFFLLAFRERYLPRDPLLYNGVQLVLMGWSLVFLGCLIGVVYNGLVVEPDMAVSGLRSTQWELHWYADRVEGKLPVPSVVSTPLWVWRLAMLAWALWLAVALLRWLRWAFDCLGAGGLFRPLTPTPRPPAASGSPDVPSERAAAETRPADDVPPGDVTADAAAGDPACEAPQVPQEEPQEEPQEVKASEEVTSEAAEKPSDAPASEGSEKTPEEPVT